MVDTGEVTELASARIDVESAEEECNDQRYYIQEFQTAIDAINDFCEDSVHKQAILAELYEHQEQAGKHLKAAERELNAAGRHLDELLRRA